MHLYIKDAGRLKSLVIYIGFLYIEWVKVVKNLIISIKNQIILKQKEWKERLNCISREVIIKYWPLGSIL
jgi:hypothetical protein